MPLNESYSISDHIYLCLPYKHNAAFGDSNTTSKSILLCSEILSRFFSWLHFPPAKVQRIFEITKKNNKIFQRPMAYYQRQGLLLVYRGIKVRRILGMCKICNFFIRGPQRAMLEWGEQRPWSPADLVERYRLCDSSAECEQALLSLKKS